MEAAADQYRQLANYTQTSADEFLNMKVQAIVMLASMLVAIAIDLVIAFYGGEEAALELLAAESTIVRLLLQTLVGRLLVHLIMTEVMSIGIQEALDAVGQLVMMAELHQDWNWGETLDMLKVGALGSAFDVALGHAGEELVKGAAEFATSGVIGGIHNAGHAALYNMMTGQPPSNFGADFMGGFWMGGSRGISRGLAGLIRLPGGMTVDISAEDLLGRGLGGINPNVLNDIANGSPRPGGDGGGPSGAGGGPAEGGVPVAERINAPGAEPVAPAVAILHAAGIDAGTGTAYSIALRTGYVPTIGPASDHPLYREPVMAHVQMSGFLVPREQPQMPDLTAQLNGQGAASAAAPHAAELNGLGPQPSGPRAAELPAGATEPPAQATELPGNGQVEHTPAAEPAPASAQEPHAAQLNGLEQQPTPPVTHTTADPQPGPTTQTPSGAGGLPNRTAEPVAGTGGVQDRPVEPVAGAGGVQDRPVEPVAGAGGVQDRPVEPVAGAGGVQDRPVEPVAGAGGVQDRPVEPVAGAGGVQDRPVEPVAGAGGVQDRPVEPVAGAGGVQDRPVEPVAGAGGVQDRPVEPVAGTTEPTGGADRVGGTGPAEEPQASGGHPLPAPKDGGSVEHQPTQHETATDTAK